MKNSGKGDVLVFTHAGVMMNVMLILGIIPLEKLFGSQPPYGGMITVEV